MLKDIKLSTFMLYGDSRSIIDGIYGQTTFLPPHFDIWVAHIKLLNNSIENMIFSHVSRDLNSVVDGILKNGLLVALGSIHLRHVSDGFLMEEGGLHLI